MAPLRRERLAAAFAWLVVRLRFLVVAGWIVAAVAANARPAGARKRRAARAGGPRPARLRGDRGRRAGGGPLLRSAHDRHGRRPARPRRPLGRGTAARAGTGGPGHRPRRRRRGDRSRASGPEHARARPVLARARDDCAHVPVVLPGRKPLGPGDARPRLRGGGLGAGRRAGRVTGPAAARWQQFQEIEGALPIVEAGTVGLIALVVGITFRAVGAPLLVLFASAISFLLSSRLIPWVGKPLDASMPQEVEPLVVALTLGIVTDYTIFFLSACRRRLAEGEARIDAAEHSAANVAPIVPRRASSWSPARRPSSRSPSRWCPLAWRSSGASPSGRTSSRATAGPARTTGRRPPATPSHASSPRLRWPRSSRS
jgi:RND superfamily putative drug exporter